MARKLSVIVALGFVFLIFSLSNSGTSFEEGQQVPGPQMQQIMFEQPFDIQKEIEVLKGINEVGLTDEQLQELQSTIQDLLMARAAREEAQDDLRSFLLKFKGSEFSKEFALHQEALQTAVNDFDAKLEETVTKIEGMLTPEQNEALLHYIFQQYIREFLTSNLELLGELVACKLNPEPCLPTKPVEGR